MNRKRTFATAIVKASFERTWICRNATQFSMCCLVENNTVASTISLFCPLRIVQFNQAFCNAQFDLFILDLLAPKLELAVEIVEMVPVFVAFAINFSKMHITIFESNLQLTLFIALTIFKSFRHILKSGYFCEFIVNCCTMKTLGILPFAI